MTRATSGAELRTQTQWTAQFLAAAELTRQGYVVSFTMGNHTPVADLMVGIPHSGQQFWIDVKGQSGRNGWIVKPKKHRPDLYYILVFAGERRADDRFFILSQSEATSLSEKHKLDHPNARKGLGGGFSWKASEKFDGKWGTLPRKGL
jgi:hypothetical protein